jgi:peroxiredoxin
LNDPDQIPKTFAEAFALVAGLEGPLNERLAIYQQHSRRLGPKGAAAYDRLAERLTALDRDAIGPAVGTPMPEFLLPDQDGHLVDLESLRQSGPVVVSFNRGHWCPYCRLDLRALAAVAPEVARLGGRVVSIVPERAEFTRRLATEHQLPFLFLSDVDLSYALELGLIFWIGEELKTLYDAAGVDLARYQGGEGTFLPVAAKFVVGTDGVVKARGVDVEYRQRTEPSAILAALCNLKNGV